MGLQGLYLIADTTLLSRHNNIVEWIEPLIKAGISIVQLRDKPNNNNISYQEKYELASALLKICHTHKVPFLINDDVEFAIAVKADGVHLGKTDMAIRTARLRLGADRYIGASCYTSSQRAADAKQQGADYVAFGSVYPSITKPNATRLTTNDTSDQSTLNQLRRLSADSALPVCAIGGITPDNAKAVVDCGVQMIAVASGILTAPNPHQAVKQYLATLKSCH